MPRQYHDIKYLQLTPVYDGSTLLWQGKNLKGTLDEVQSRYEAVLREQLHFGNSVSCSVTPLIGFYTIDPTIQYSRIDYKWNPATNAFVGPDFNETGSLDVLLPRVESFLKAQTHRTVSPMMSLMFTFYSGELDVRPVVVNPVPVPAPKPGPVPARRDSVDSVGSVGPAANIFGDDDDF